MLRATLKSLLSRKLRLILSSLAVVLGVMFVSGAFVLTNTLGRSFDQLFTGIYAHTAVQVTAAPKLASSDLGGDTTMAVTIPANVVDQVRGVSGVAAATGQVMVDGAHLVGSDGKVVPTTGAPRFGSDWASHASDVELREGHGPNADNEIAINAALAKAADVKVGDEVGILTPVLRSTTRFTLVGVFGFPGGKDSTGGSQMIAFTLPEAQKVMLGTPDAFSSIDVKAAPGVTNDQLRDRISANLGSGYVAKTGQQLTNESKDSFQKALSFFNNILIGFAGVALFVAIFLILNTFSIIVAQRTKELALMRALGAGRRQVIGSVLTEAVTIGLFSAVLGLGLGIGVGALLAKLFSQIGGGGLELAGLGVPAAAVISAFAVGVGVTVLAALIPALRASRIPPVAAMRDAETTDKPLTKLSVAGGIVFGLGAVLLTVGLTGSGGDNTLWAILGGVLLAFVGAALLTPLIARPVSGLIGRIFAWSVPGRLGRLNSGRNPRRTAITASALMVGIALVIGINTIVASAKESLTRVADSQAHIDLIISGDQNSDTPSTFDPTILDRLKTISGVAASTGIYLDGAEVNHDRTVVAAFSDLSVVPAMFSLTPTAGSISTVNEGEIIVDEPTATRNHLAIGSPVTVQLAKGDPLHLKLSGIYAKSDLVNGWVIPLDATRNFTVVAPAQGFVQAAPGASIDAIKAQVKTLLADSPEVNVADRAEYLAQQSSSIDQVLTMIQILLALAILIAVLGVVNTLALSVLERTRELGLLRAVGLGRAQTMAMVTVEAVVISVFGTALGIVVGIGLGAAVVRALHDQGISDFALPWGQILTYLVLAAIIGVLAGVLPAIRAARVNVLRAISYE